MLMHSGLINSGGLTDASPGSIPNQVPAPSPSQDPSPKTPQPGPSSYVVRSGVEPRPKPPPDPLELIAEGNMRLSDIARQAGMSVLELATLVCTPRNLEALGRVAQLHAIQREMLLGQLKRDALVRLRELTDEVPAGSADEVRAAEVMRKACVDILRFGNGATRSEGGGEPGGPGSGGHRRESITPASEAEVLEALERLGEVLEKAEGGGPRRGSLSSIPHGQAPKTPHAHATRDERRQSSVGLESGVPWSKAKAQATSEGEQTREVGMTHDVQVGMAFGKTSDHGTGMTSDHGNSTTSNRTDGCGFKAGLRCLRRPTSVSIPPTDKHPFRPLRAHHRPMVGWDWEHGGCRPPPLLRRPQLESDVSRHRLVDLRDQRQESASGDGNTPGRTRTSDLRFRKPVLYPAELRVHQFEFVGGIVGETGPENVSSSHPYPCGIPGTEGLHFRSDR